MLKNAINIVIYGQGCDLQGISPFYCAHKSTYCNYKESR